MQSHIGSDQDSVKSSQVDLFTIYKIAQIAPSSEFIHAYCWII